MSDPAARSRALEYLASHQVVTIATHGPEGPWAAAVFYVNVGFNLYFLSSPTSRHAIDFAEHPRVAATVQEDYDDWRHIKGVQLVGTVEALSGSAEASAKELYAAKFPLVSGDEATPPEIAAALAKVRWYRLSAERAYFIDNAAGFGHRAEVL